jgi:hypothetical protein
LRDLRDQEFTYDKQIVRHCHCGRISCEAEVDPKLQAEVRPVGEFLAFVERVTL